MNQAEARQLLKDFGVVRMKRGAAHGIDGVVQWHFETADGSVYNLTSREDDPRCFAGALEWAWRKSGAESEPFEVTEPVTIEPDWIIFASDPVTEPIVLEPPVADEPPPIPVEPATIPVDIPDEPLEEVTQ